MPTFFPATPLLLAETVAAPTADSFRQLLAELWGRWIEHHGLPLLYLLLSQFVLIAAYWLASKPLTEWRADLGHAVRVYFLYLLLGFLLLAALVCCAIMIPMAFITWRTAHTTGPAVTAVGFSILAVVSLLLWIWFLFRIPMRVYRIGAGAALIFLLLSGGLSWLGRKGLSIVLRHPMIPSEQSAERWWAANVSGESLPPVVETPLPAGEEGEYMAAERLAADRTKTQNERLAALKDLYDRLETARKALPAGDTKALTAYERRKARYEQLLNDLRAEVAARRGNAI